MINVVTIMEKMAKSDTVFHLTGSRFFKTHSPNSDWDFYVQEADGISQELIDMGFASIEKPTFDDFYLKHGYDEKHFPTIALAKDGYNDPLCVDVYYHRDGIHVQVVSNARLKSIAQEIIRQENLLNGLSKEEQRIVWRSVIRGLQCLEKTTGADISF